MLASPGCIRSRRRDASAVWRRADAYKDGGGAAVIVTRTNRSGRNLSLPLLIHLEQVPQTCKRLRCRFSCGRYTATRKALAAWRNPCSAVPRASEPLRGAVAVSLPPLLAGNWSHGRRQTVLRKRRRATAAKCTELPRRSRSFFVWRQAATLTPHAYVAIVQALEALNVRQLFAAAQTLAAVQLTRACVAVRWLASITRVGKHGARCSITPRLGQEAARATRSCCR